ncbi:MAG: xylulokinase [Myxococcales bacterium]|nr:xylulokinase [Myxococcales bacterium]
MQHVVGIDVGTSGVKVIVVDETGRVRGEATQPLRLSTPQPGWAEQNPEDWWTATRKAVRRALGTAQVSRSQLGAVGLSGQMHSAVFLDAQGLVIRPALLWCDGRTSAECADITTAVGAQRLRKTACNPALEGFTLPKILWLRRHEPAAFRRLAKVVLAKDYIRFRLTGTLATDPSDASATLMFDTVKRTWSREVLDAVGLSRALTVDVVGSTEPSGTVTREAARQTGLPEGLVVAGGGADNACGALGVGAIEPGVAVASWGTSGTVLAPTPLPLVDPALRVHTFCHAVPDTWYVMGVMLTAGGAFAWFRDQMARDLHRKTTGKSPELQLNEEAAGVPIGAAGLTFLPYLQGERTPHRDAAARGAFVGLSLAHDRAHLARAVLEGIAFGLRDSVSLLQDLELPIARLLLTGGGAKSPFLRQLQADVFGLPVVQVNRDEGPAFGAALLAAVCAGLYPNLGTACRKTLTRLPPEKPNRKAHRSYDAPYARFRALYPALKDHV